MAISSSSSASSAYSPSAGVNADYFLKLAGIDGEATDKVHKGSIDLMSWSWGASNAGSFGHGGGGGAGKVAMQDFHFTMRVNKASPKLFFACASGQHIKEATLTCRKAGGQHMTVKFTDVLVSSYQAGGAQGGDVMPVDQISLNFSKIEVSYLPQDAKGGMGSPVKTGWDIAQNAKV